MENYDAMKNISDMFAKANYVKIPVSKNSKGFSPRKPKKPIKLGSTCPNCFEKKSITGSCFCNL